MSRDRRTRRPPAELRECCRGAGNLMQPLRAALADRCTVGEVCGVMREEFGEYREA